MSTSVIHQSYRLDASTRRRIRRAARSLASVALALSAHACRPAPTIRDCPHAAAIIATGAPAARDAWVYSVIASCPGDAGTALAHGLERLRTAPDTLAISALMWEADVWRDGAIYRAASAIADDRSASLSARLFAIRYLMLLDQPGRIISVIDLMRPNFDPARGGVDKCDGLSVTDWPLRQGAPLPSTMYAELVALGASIEADSSNPAGVRSAASCLTALRYRLRYP